MTPLIALPAASGPALPELPALSRLLQAARRLPGSADWRSGVLSALGFGDSADLAPARLAACALPAMQAGSSLCLALPVHVVAGISRMFLAPAGSVAVDAVEREALRVAFNNEFGAAALQLHAVGAGWLLEAPFASAADEPDPAALGGAALSREPARTAAAKLLRRLGAEVEMWLASAPVNRQREQRGVPPINCFWFWSGAQVAAVARPAQCADRIFSHAEPDAWTAGLAALCGTSAQQAPGWAAAREKPALIILQPPALGDVTAWLPVWEAEWFAPAVRDLEARDLPALRLQIGDTAWQLPAPRLTRWFRRSRPWWQAVSA